MDKKQILNNIESISGEDLSNFIEQGFITFEELKNSGRLDRAKRKIIEDCQLQKDSNDDEVWNRVNQNSYDDVIYYITSNPTGKHVAEAKRALGRLAAEDEINKAKKMEILNKISRNPNSFSASEISDYLMNGTITKNDLLDCGIPESVVDNVDNVNKITLDIGSTPDEIPTGFTEVYFWGMPGSGKTCALGAILNKAHQKGYLKLVPLTDGYSYAFALKNIFSDDNVADDYLPNPTPLEVTQFIPFTLKKPEEKYSRSVSLIELSGEIFECFHSYVTKKGFKTEKHEQTFGSVTRFLDSPNRKVHFFFIEYKQKHDANQSMFLESTSAYFENFSIFKKTTDVIYVIVTKSDMITDENGCFVKPEERQTYAKKYLENNYAAFINTLKDICRKNSINGKVLSFEPFSLGAVYFKDICNFNGRDAEKVVDILMDRIPQTKDSIFSKLLNK